MSSLVSTINTILSVLTVIGQIAVLGLLVTLVAARKNNVARALLDFIQRHALLLALIVSLTAMLGSLFYSEVAEFTPCKLCWYQRIFLYPQVILFAVALWKRDRGIRVYGLTLSLIGGLIAGYHYLLQLGVAPALPCAAVGYSASCSQRFVMTFGYVTIPLMALTAFALLIILAVARGTKRYTFDDIKKLQSTAKTKDRNLSRKIDEIVYDL